MATGIHVRHAALGLLGLIALGSLSGCATTYSAAPLQAWVVDAETGAPVEGAVVVAHWRLRFGLEGQGTDLELMEAVTGADGRFAFPAWGPKPLPPDVPSSAYLLNLDPQLIVLKSGYLPRAVANTIRSMEPGPGPSLRTSEWNARRIEIMRTSVTDRAYVGRLESVLVGVSWGGCGWTRIPRAMVALDREARRLSHLGIDHIIPNMRRIINTSERKECANVHEILKAYEQ